MTLYTPVSLIVKPLREFLTTFSPTQRVQPDLTELLVKWEECRDQAVLWIDVDLPLGELMRANINTREKEREREVPWFPGVDGDFWR